MNDTELFAAMVELEKNINNRFAQMDNKIKSIMEKVNKIERDLDFHKNCIGNHSN